MRIRNVAFGVFLVVLLMGAALQAGATLKTTFPVTPTPATVTIPGGGFAGGQTFTFATKWDNDWDSPINVTFHFKVVEVDPLFNDRFSFFSNFMLPANAMNFTVTFFPTLTAAQLNSANDGAEGCCLEFIIEKGSIEFSHKKDEDKEPVNARQNFQKLWVPQIGHGVSGDFGFRSEILVTNLSTAGNEVHVETFDSDAAPMALLSYGDQPATMQVEERLRGRQGMILRSSGGDEGLSIGYAKVSSMDRVGVEVLYQIYDRRDGRVVSSTILLPRPLINRASITAISGEGGRTAFGIVNPGDDECPAEVNLQAFSEEGDLIAETTLTIAPGSQISTFLDEVIPGLQD
ncbi:MAG: hypothetical protein V3T83_13580, partial [Acidobacteriota bacterium]